MTYTIRYYDIGWNVHSARIEDASPEEAINKLLASKICTRSEVITYYEGEIPMPYVQAPQWNKARVSYNYCTICGHVPKKDEPANRAPLKFWDPDDGWKIGTLCPWCADDALTTEPKQTDFAFKEDDDLMQLIINVETDEDPLLAL